MDLSLLADPLILSELVFQGLVRGSMYALMGIGLSLIFGILGIVNFAHGELFMIGTYVMYFVAAVLELPFVAGILLAAVALFLVGMAIERGLVEPLRRRAGRDWLLDSFVLTIGLMVVLQNLALLGFGSRRRGVTSLLPGSLQLGAVSITYERLAIFLIALLVVVALFAFVKATHLGKAIRATAQNAEAAQTLGIDVGRVYTLAFGIGAALAGIAGALLISIFPAFPTVGYQPVLKSFAVVILGGLGNIPGAIAAGYLLGVIEAYGIFFLSAGWQSVLTPLLIVLVLIFRPQGLFTPQGERAMSARPVEAPASRTTLARTLKVGMPLALLLAAPPLWDSPYVTTVFISALMFGLFGAIYDLMIGFCGLTNFGYAGFIAAGAYGSALASFHFTISPWLGLGIGGLAAAALGLFTGIITLRLRGLYLGLTTWFVAEALRFTISNTPQYTRGVLGSPSSRSPTCSASTSRAAIF